MLSMKPFLVFDLDGTLIHSAKDICTAVNYTLRDFGKPLLDEKLITAHIGEGPRRLIRDIYGEDSVAPISEAELERVFMGHYRKVMLDTTYVFPGVFDFLEAYQGKIAIITNKTEALARVMIDHLGLNKFPWVQIFGADTLGEKKPSPLPLKTMMGLAQETPPNTIMVGDGTPDVESAQRAGVRSIAISFGFTEPEILARYNPAAFLDHYHELPNLIDRLSQQR